MKDTSPRLWAFIFCLAPFIFLWLALIRHLSVEWAINPQYGYGWFVPGLCAYLAWRNWRSAEDTRDTMPDQPNQRVRRAISVLLAACYAPTRLVQEANPEWRLVSWALATEVVGLTLLLLPLFLTSCASNSAFSRLSVFPFLFFLVAVPWPTFIERPALRCLQTATAHGTAEILACFGVPSVLHGSAIEINSGWVGINEACSGLRSFQASLMLALLFGEVYRLEPAKRLVCVAVGFVFALCFNLLRTTLLAFVGSWKGSQALAGCHDTMGLGILLGCFTGIWLLARYLHANRHQPCAAKPHDQPGPASSSGKLARPARRWYLPIGFACWIGFVELGTEAWYHIHEQQAANPARWHLELLSQLPQFRQLNFAPAIKQMLRFDDGLNAVWQDENSLRWQAIFLRWNPGRVAIHLARNHTPEDCLVAAGRPVSAASSLRFFSVHGLKLPFRSYVARDEAGFIHVFYCLWEDGAVQQSFQAEWLTYASRLEPVLAGQRNAGQRSLQLVLWGAANDEEAEMALQNLLPKIIMVEQ